MPSTSSCSRARKSERGFALMAAIGLAILYFALVELMLIDSSRALTEARRFRAKITATVLAENGAELAAVQMLSHNSATESGENEQGVYSGQMQRVDGGPSGDATFRITGSGETTGTDRVRARVDLDGRIVGTDIRIQYALHRQ